MDTRTIFTFKKGEKWGSPPRVVGRKLIVTSTKTMYEFKLLVDGFERFSNLVLRNFTTPVNLDRNQKDTTVETEEYREPSSSLYLV